jgi:4-hydroxyphenylpyruvate dioxygenase
LTSRSPNRYSTGNFSRFCRAVGTGRALCSAAMAAATGSLPTIPEIQPMTHPDSNSSARSTPDDGARDNPLGIAGLEFVEFSSPDPASLATLFGRLGFVPVARHVSKVVTLYRQGSMNFLINAEPDSFASRFAETHGVGICAIGIRVVDAQTAHERAVDYGAWDFEGEKIGPNELAIPAIQGIGDSHIYFVDH